MTWSASLYSKFEDERSRPARDLVVAIPLQDVGTAIDLGCGPGNSTEILAQRYPSAVISGIDSSGDMVNAARKRLPLLAFEVGDIATWRASQTPDVILANASLQWLADHESLYPRLLSQLRVGGCLAVQTPDNLAEPGHRLAREIATDTRWADKIGRVQHPHRHEPSWYYELLRPLCSRVDVWRTTYFHALQDHQAIVEWFKGTALRPYLGPLTDAEREIFLARYLHEISLAYPVLRDGSVLLPFPRLFIVALR